MYTNEPANSHSARSNGFFTLRRREGDDLVTAVAYEDPLLFVEVEAVVSFRQLWWDASAKERLRILQHEGGGDAAFQSVVTLMEPEQEP